MPLWSGKKSRGGGSISEVSQSDYLSMIDPEKGNFDLVEWNDDTPGMEFAVITPRSRRGLSNELGTTSPSPFTSFTRQEYNPALQGLRGLEVYDKMRKSDGAVRGTLRLIKTPALSGRWFVEPAAPAYQTAEQIEEYKEQAKFIWCCLTEYMSISWPQVLAEALLMCDFGYYMFEKVWTTRMYNGEMRTVLQKLAPRHPMDVKEWHYDTHGGPSFVTMYRPVNDTARRKDIDIPIDDLVVFTFDREAGNIEGISVLRSAYKHWYFVEQLYKIDAIQKERHGIGIPVIKLPLGFGDEDKRIAEELARNIRTNERAHIVLPPNWEVMMLKLEGQLVDPLDSIEHHDERIRENILANFVTENAREEDLVMFFKAARIVADLVASTFNLYLIPQLVKYNWPLQDEMPKLRVRRIGESADWRTLSFALRNMVGAGLIIPDEQLEANLREEMDLPAIDEATARMIATPQNPYDEEPGLEDAPDDPNDPVHNTNNPNYNRGNNVAKQQRKKKPGRKNRGQIAGLPRQSAPSARAPRPNSGQDRSGG